MSNIEKAKLLAKFVAESIRKQGLRCTPEAELAWVGAFAQLLEEFDK